MNGTVLGLSLLSAGLAWLGSRGPERSARSLGPNVAGTWYPASPSALAAQVDEMLAKAASAPPLGEVTALVAPHAGFVYSGPVAAAGFRTVRDARRPRVVIIGPSHYVAFRGAAVPDADELKTPLGAVPLDLDALDSVRHQPGFQTLNDAFRREHALEAEVPFLQRSLGAGFRLVPVLIGAGCAGDLAQQVAEVLKPLLEPGTLVVVSSDFTHYGESFGYVPFREDVPARIRDLDMGAVELIVAADVPGFERYLARTGATVCGRDAVNVLMRMLPAGIRATLLDYDASGRMTGDWSHSVSYAALAFHTGEDRA